MIKNLLYLSILTTAVVISWIGFTIYHNNATSTISGDTSIRITPIPAQFDKETIETLKTKKVIPADLNQNRASVSTTTELGQEVATSSGEASGSGQIKL